jgi:hypothetical protein
MQTTDLDRDLDNALHAWSAWMRSDGVKIGFPPRAVGVHSSAGMDFDDLIAGADAVLARAVDAVIDDMPARLRSALSAAHLRCRWVGDPDDLPYALLDAREALGNGLRRRRVL